MNPIVFDIETKNTFQDVGTKDPALLDISIVAIYNPETDEYISYTEDELKNLWSIIEKADALVGFNSDHFDIPLLNRYYPGNLFQVKSIDLMKTIQNSLGRRIGLDAVAQATLGTGKTAHGLQAIKWWRDGEIDKIRKYCIDDVKVTKQLFEYMKENKKIKYKDLSGKIIEIDVDISDWGKKEDSGLTHILPF